MLFSNHAECHIFFYFWSWWPSSDHRWPIYERDPGVIRTDILTEFHNWMKIVGSRVLSRFLYFNNRTSQVLSVFGYAWRKYLCLNNTAINKNSNNLQLMLPMMCTKKIVPSNYVNFYSFLDRRSYRLMAELQFCCALINKTMERYVKDFTSIWKQLLKQKSQQQLVQPRLRRQVRRGSIAHQFYL